MQINIKNQISQVLNNAADSLTDSSSTPVLDAEILLSFILKKNKEYLYTHGDKELSEKQIHLLSKFIRKRIDGYPIAYITGHKEFYGLDFIVTPDTLIPRPETEMMVEHLLDHLKQLTQNTTVIDVGTGTGCIPISIIKNLQTTNNKLKITAIDISMKALEVAKKNAKKHNLENDIEFIHGNLLEPILNTSRLKPQTSNLIITANLPYLTPKQIKNSPSIQKEPELALEAGDDGLKYYKKLFNQIKKITKIVNC